MSRPLVLALVVLVLIVGGLVALSFLDTEVPVTRIEAPVANAQAPQ